MSFLSEAAKSPKTLTLHKCVTLLEPDNVEKQTFIAKRCVKAIRDGELLTQGFSYPAGLNKKEIKKMDQEDLSRAYTLVSLEEQGSLYSGSLYSGSFGGGPRGSRQLHEYRDISTGNLPNRVYGLEIKQDDFIQWCKEKGYFEFLPADLRRSHKDEKGEDNKTTKPKQRAKIIIEVLDSMKEDSSFISNNKRWPKTDIWKMCVKKDSALFPDDKADMEEGGFHKAYTAVKQEYK